MGRTTVEQHKYIQWEASSITCAIREWGIQEGHGINGHYYRPCGCKITKSGKIDCYRKIESVYFDPELGRPAAQFRARVLLNELIMGSRTKSPKPVIRFYNGLWTVRILLRKGVLRRQAKAVIRRLQERQAYY